MADTAARVAGLVLVEAAAAVAATVAAATEGGAALGAVAGNMADLTALGEDTC